MTRLTRGLRAVLGLCLLTTLGIFGAGSAQAATWMVNGTNLTSGTKVVKGVILAPGAVIRSSMSGNKIEVVCKSGGLSHVEVEKEGRIKEDATLRFTECTTSINGVIQKSCEPINNGTEKGVIVGNKSKGGLIEDPAGEGAINIESTIKEKIEGKEVSVFAHIKTSEECSIGEDVPIIGPRLSLIDVAGMGEPSPGTKEGLLHEQKSHTVKLGALTELWMGTETVEHKVLFEGALSVQSELGFTWSGLIP